MARVVGSGRGLDDVCYTRENEWTDHHFEHALDDTRLPTGNQ